MKDALPIPILTGPTASGKTALAIAFAQSHPELGIEIVNADSLLVYRGLNIGTAKPSLTERAGIPHHLIDIRDPDQSYTAADFVRDAQAAIQDIRSRGGHPLIVGGTGFYIKALCFGLWDARPTQSDLRAQLASVSTPELFQRLQEIDPPAAAQISPSDRYRIVRAIELEGEAGAQMQKSRVPASQYRILVCEPPADLLERRIVERTTTMLDAGLESETQNLLNQYPDARCLRSVGYLQVLQSLGLEPRPTGRKIPPTRQGLHSEIVLATRQLAKSQRTWCRGQFQNQFGPERYQVLNPMDPTEHSRAFTLLARWLQGQ